MNAAAPLTTPTAPSPHRGALLGACAWALTAAAVLGGCAAPSVHATTPSPKLEFATPAPGLDAELFYQLLLAEMLLQQSDPGAAYSLMFDAARRTQSPELYRRAIEVALHGRAGNAALAAAQEWARAFPDADEPYRYELQILLALNRPSEIGRALEQLIRLTPAERRNEVIGAIPQTLARTSDPAAALQATRQALQPALREPATAGAAWATLGRMEMQRQALPAALEAARAGLRAQPDSAFAAALAVELFERELAGAEALVLSFLERDQPAAIEQRSAIRLAYIRALIDLRRLHQAQQQLERLLAHEPDLAEAWLLQGILQTQQRRLAAAEASLQKYLQLLGPLPPEQAARGQAKAFLQLAQIAQQRRDFPAAHAWLDRIANAEDIFAVQVRRASLLAQEGQVAQARALLQRQPDRTDADVRQNMLAEARLLRDISAYLESFQVLTAAALRFPNDPDIAYEQAMAAKKTGDFDHMEALLRRLIERHPDYYHAYNALGYSLADRNLRLEEARSLIQKALAAAPNNAYILDSLGWVEFRLGNKEKALAILQDAYRRMPDAEIAAHLGEVHWALGQREQALTAWREGLRLDPENATLRQTLQRFQVQP